MTTPSEVVQRRHAPRRALIGKARVFVNSLDAGIGVRGAVFGSVARGRLDDASDVDVVVIAEAPPTDPLDRLAAVGTPPGRVEPIVWSVEDWRRARRRGNPVGHGGGGPRRVASPVAWGPGPKGTAPADRS